MNAASSTPQNLSDELETISAAIGSANASLVKSQDELKRLNARVTALKKLINELETSQSSLAKQRDTAGTTTVVGQQTYDSQMDRLQRDLTTEQRAAVDSAVKAVDDGVAAAEAKQSAAQTAFNDAASASNAASRTAKEHEASLRDAQAELRGLASRLQQSQDQTTKLVTAVKAATAAGRLAEAYYQATLLKAALGQLSMLADPKREAELQTRIQTEWSALGTATDAVASAAATLTKARVELTAADKELQTRQQARPAVIKSALDALQQQWKPAPKPATAPVPASTTTTTPAIELPPPATTDGQRSATVEAST